MERRDEELIANALATGDPAHYDKLLRRYQSDVRNWLRHLTGDFARADDLAQETFIQAWQRLHTIRDAGKFKAWAMKIAYNLFLQERRRHGREAEKAQALGRELLASGNHVAERRDPGVADLPRMLAALTDEERTATVLNYAFGMSHREISELTAWPLGTVKSHIRRATARLRERFDMDRKAHGRSEAAGRGRAADQGARRDRKARNREGRMAGETHGRRDSMAGEPRDQADS